MAFIPLLGSLIGGLFGGGKGIGGALDDGTAHTAMNIQQMRDARLNADEVVQENMFTNQEVTKFTNSSISTNTEMQIAKQQGQIFFGAQQIEQQLVKSATQALQAG